MQTLIAVMVVYFILPTSAWNQMTEVEQQKVCLFVATQYAKDFNCKDIEMFVNVGQKEVRFTFKCKKILCERRDYEQMPSLWARASSSALYGRTDTTANL